jgi:hypothetical protein
MALAAVTRERVAAAAMRLGADGWRFTGRQLYYEVCRDVELPRTRIAPGEVGFGAVLVLVGVITGQHIALFILGGLGVLLIALGAVTHLAERRPEPDARVLAMSFFAFSGEHLDGQSYEGLVREGAAPQTNTTGATVLLCDRAETAALVRANATRIDAPLVITDRASLDNVDDAARMVVLHDCDPAGCALVVELQDRGVELVDAGLNPRDVIGHRAQLIEGAPARLPRDLSAHLSAEEVEWLISGRRLELATLTPEATISRVRAVLSR